MSNGELTAEHQGGQQAAYAEAEQTVRHVLERVTDAWRRVRPQAKEAGRERTQLAEGFAGNACGPVAARPTD